MSDNFLRLIPVSPAFLPAGEAQERAVAVLRALLPGADRVEAKVLSNVEFIDPGVNFESVTCPSCGADVTGYWPEWMDTAAESQFSQLEIELPCCGPSDLNTLNYSWPAGFARFVVEVMNPPLDGWLPPTDMALLEEALECRLRQIRAHL